MGLCAACGTENPEGSRFCNSCGAMFPASATGEERKVVTALFCDLVGFTQRGFAMAAGVFHTCGVVLEEAYALAGSGRCLLAQGETAEAVGRFQEAHAIFERLRAGPRITEIDRILAGVA